MFSKQKLYFVKVITLDTELEMTITQSTTGMQLFNQVCETIGLREVWYFGIQFLNEENEIVWLDLLKKVSKQVGTVKGQLHLYFRAKYFPEDVCSELIHENTVYLFYLQVRESILNDEIQCPLETSILLASYACQAKFGDYAERLMPPGFLAHEHLIPQRLMEQSDLSTEELERSVVRWYREHQNMLRWDAMLEYLHIAQDLEMYGVTYFEIRNKKGTNVLLGVDPFGLNIYNSDNRLTPQLCFPWSEISNVSFKRHKFIITSVDKSSEKLTFYSAHVQQNQRLLSLCIGSHELYTRRRKQEPIEIQHMRAQANAEREAKIHERERLLQALRAQQNAEMQLKQMTVRVEREASEQERVRQNAEDLARRVQELENQLLEEARIRRQLEDAQKRLEEKNQELERACAQQPEQRAKLLQEQCTIQQEINQLNHSMIRSSMRLRTKRAALAQMSSTFSGIDVEDDSLVHPTVNEDTEPRHADLKLPSNSEWPSEPVPDCTLDPHENPMHSPVSVVVPAEPPEACPVSDLAISHVVDTVHMNGAENGSLQVMTQKPQLVSTPYDSADSEPSAPGSPIQSCSSASISSHESSDEGAQDEVHNWAQSRDVLTVDTNKGLNVMTPLPNHSRESPKMTRTTVPRAAGNESHNPTDCAQLRFDMNYMYASHPDMRGHSAAATQSPGQDGVDSLRTLSVKTDPDTDSNRLLESYASNGNNRHSMYTRVPPPLDTITMTTTGMLRLSDGMRFCRGEDRLRTLRGLRQGNTKRRVEEFESM